MALYALAQQTSVTTVGASWEIRSAPAIKAKILEIQLFQISATTGEYGFGRPGAIGLLPSGKAFFKDEGDGNGALGQTIGATGWGVAPTQPTDFNRRWSTGPAIGAGVILTFPRGFGLPPSNSVVIWNIVSPISACDVSAVVDE